MKIGDRVKSHYRAPWSGVIVSLEKRKGYAPLATVAVDTDRHGNPMRKVEMHELDVTWLELLGE